MISHKALFALFPLVFVTQAVLSNAQTPAPADVHVKLVLADNKTSFRMGEPIGLFMEFTADVEGYQVETFPDRKEPTSDSISISPESGISHWLDDMNGGVRYPRDVFSTTKLSTSPTRVSLALNDTLRFDRPGHYTVKLTTKRVSTTSSLRNPRPQIVLTTNEVEFEVLPMSDEEETKEVKRLTALLDAKRDLQTDENVTQELSYLTGDISAREKVRRFLNPENRSANYSGHIAYGLYIARNRELVLQLLETALRDPNQPVNTVLMNTVTRLRFLQENTGAPVEPRVVGELSRTVDPRTREIQNAYLTELAAGLSKRHGKSLTTTALTILTMSKKDAENAPVLTREARRVLVQQFDSLHPFDQDTLLRNHWEELRDPSLAASLKKILSYSAVATQNNHESALKRLLEIAPEEGRTYLIAEIRDPFSLVDLETLNSLSDKSLPVVDSSLLEQIRRLTASTQPFDRIFLRQKVALAVRYATENIYQDVREIYREAAARLPLESRAALLAYLAKQNERETIPLIEQTLGDIRPEEDFNFLPELTKLYYSEGIAALLKKQLDGNEPQAASNAAYLIGKHGAPGDESVLQEKLGRWRQEWADRPTEADANNQGMVERELIYALLHGKAWKLPAERVKELQQSCVTKVCRQSIQVP